MFCSQCGADNTSDSKYCKECGTYVAPSSISLAPNPQDFDGVEDPLRQERLTKLLDMAFWHLDVGNLDAAVLASEAALTINPRSTTAHSLLGTLYEKKGNDAKAIAHVESVLEINPNSEADAAKLEMLRRGVRAMAVPPPAGFRWIPPALAGSSLGDAVGRVADISERVATGGPGARLSDRIADWKLGERKIGGLQMLPVLYSAAAAVLVFAVCFGAIRSSRSAGAAPEQIVSVTASPSPVNGSAFADPSRVALVPAASRPAPFSAPGNTFGSSDALHPPFTAKNLDSTPDPFSERLASPAGTKPLTTSRIASLPQRGRTHRVASAAMGGEPGALPALQLHAIAPSADGMLAPAPVAAPLMASVEPMNRHTVVVPALGGGDQSQPQDGAQYGGAQNSGSQYGGDQQSNGPAPIIRITVHDAGDNSPDSLGVGRNIIHGRSPDGGGGGDSFQQTALSLQSAGNYRAARAAYEKAIHTFKADIAAGRNQESAQRGLQACQTGLQICKQSE